MKMKWMKFPGTFQMDQIIQVRSPDLVLINQKKRTCYLVDFRVLVDQRLNVKKEEKLHKYRNIDR